MAGPGLKRHKDIWKYGETTQDPPENRYGGSNKKMGLQMFTEKSRTQKQMKIEEKKAPYRYYSEHKHLPPGNSIFR